jgi:hypothetical protein
MTVTQVEPWDRLVSVPSAPSFLILLLRGDWLCFEIVGNEAIPGGYFVIVFVFIFRDKMANKLSSTY